MWNPRSKLYRAILPYYCCGLIVLDDRVVDAAPIARWSVGKSLDEFKRWAATKRGAVEEVPE